jgi:REP element-mobilizing transposase RayT
MERKRHNKLPHISLKGHYQFVTFRTHESVDAYIKKIQNSSEIEKIKQYKIDSYLDTSKKGAYFYDEIIDIMMDVILEEDENLYDMEIVAIMPNHIHLLFRQNAQMPEIMKYLRAKSAIEINRHLKREGKFWAEGYFDKLIRDERHFETVYNYIKNNPLKAGLKDERVFSKYE